jgi:hypothetical protein
MSNPDMLGMQTKVTAEPFFYIHNTTVLLLDTKSIINSEWGPFAEMSVPRDVIS